MRIFLITILVIAGVLNTELVKATDQEPSIKAYEILIPNFNQTANPDADKACDAIIIAYTKSINDILSQLRASQTNAAKTRLIYVLGELRAKIAVPQLTEIIDFEAEQIDPALAPRRWGSHPAQEALVKIGSDSVSYIVIALGKEENKTRRQLMLQVLADVLGKDVAQFMIEKTVKSATDSERHNYADALAILNGM